MEISWNFVSPKKWEPCLHDSVNGNTFSFPHRRPHEVFGDVKKLITQEFVKQLYLECDKVPKSEPPVFDFSWGPRALQELRKRSCLELVSEVTTLQVYFVVQRVEWRTQKP